MKITKIQIKERIMEIKMIITLIKELFILAIVQINPTKYIIINI
jgi:hypothetical protein